MYVKPVENQVRWYFVGGIIMLILALICGIAIDAYGQCENGRCPVPGTCPPQARQQWQAPRIQGVPASIRSAVPLPGICRVAVTRRRETNYGSGTLVWEGPNRAVVLTVYHIFRNDRTGRVQWDRVEVIFPDGRKVEAERVTTNARIDLGMIVIPKPGVETVPILREPPKVNDRVFLCGYGPSGNYRSLPGIVRGYGSKPSGKTYDLLVSGEARLGDSGGAILNARNELVGIIWATDGETTRATYTGVLCQFFGDDQFIAPWNAGLAGEKIRAAAEVEAARIKAAANSLPMVPVAPAVTAGGMDMVVRQVNALNDRVTSLEKLTDESLGRLHDSALKLDANMNDSMAAIGGTAKEALDQTKRTADGLVDIQEGLLGRVKGHVVGLVKSWIPGGLLGGGIIGVVLFFVLRKVFSRFVGLKIAEWIDNATDKTSTKLDDKYLDPIAWKLSSLLSGKPVPGYAYDPGMDAYGNPIPGHQPQAPVPPGNQPTGATQPTAKEVELQAQINTLAAVVTPPPPTAKELELLAQIDVLKAAKG